MRIGLSSCFFHADRQRPIFKGKTLLYLEQSMARWLMREGALPFLIPAPGAGAGVSLRDLVTEMHGLVLQGGSDVSPRSYGERSLRPEWDGDYVRDQYEMELCREFLSQKKPILGICRGAQLLNVFFGGTLYQDIATQVPNARVHRDWEIYDQNFHEIRIEKESLLELLCSESRGFKVNSIHHQAIKDLGNGVRVEARSADDQLVEAIQYPASSFVYAVQWHPEFHSERDSELFDTAPILRAFLKEAATRA